MNATIPVGAIIAAKRKQIINTFRRAGATTPGAAISTEAAGIRESIIFKRLVSTGVLVGTFSGHYYLDEAAEAESRKQRRRLITVLLIIVTVLIVAGFFISHKEF